MFQVGSYGGKLKYTISYVAGPRGTLLDDADVQIIVSVFLKRIQFVLHVKRLLQHLLTCLCRSCRETTSLWWLVSPDRGGSRAAGRLISLRSSSER